MATFEPRHSFRSSQTRNGPSNSSTNNPNTSSSSSNTALPDIDFGFDALKDRMSKFSSRFDDYIVSERQNVLDDRNGYRERLAELRETSARKKENITSLSSASSQHAHALAREAAETREMEAAIASLSLSRDTHAAHNAAVQGQIAQTKSLISQKLAAQATYAEKVAAQAALNEPELAFYEEYLGLRIESYGDDRIAFVYSELDERDPERGCKVLLDLSRRDYAILETEPRLKGVEVDGVVGRLNEGRELAPFLKEMRGLLRKKCREGA